MKSRLLPFAAILVAAFVSCQQTQSLEVNKLEALGNVELTFDLQNNTAKAAFVSSHLNSQALLANQTSVSFASSQFQVFNSGANNFLVAKFNVTNTSGGALTDLALVAYRKTGNRSDTAILNLQNFNTLTSPALDAYALAIKPAHAMSNSTTVNSAEADTQFFTEAEVATMQGQASALPNPVLTNGDYLFPYGYIARATGSTTSRSIATGTNTGTLTVGVKLPNNNEPSTAVTRFSMTFIALTQPTASRVSESLEEQGSATANARKTSLNATELFALGGSSLLSNPSVKRGCVIRTAGASGAATATLVDTFSLSTTPIANSFNAAASANLNLTLDRNGVTPTAANWITRGEFTGDKAGAFSGGGSSTLTFNPTNNFKPGELVTTTLKSGAVTTSPAANPCVTGTRTWQFRAGVTAGGGTYGGKTDTATGNGPLAVLGDMNNDGNLDVIAVSDASSQISVLPGNGAGGFGTRVNFATGTTPYTLAVGDLNADGKLDVVTANEGSNNASVLINNTSSATPSFAAKVDYAAGTRPYGIALADVSNDGILDMIVSNFGLDANTGADTASVRLGTGTGTFGSEATFGTGNRPNIIAIGDVNNDGKLDIAVTNQTPIGVGTVNTVSVLLGNGNGTFQTKVDYEIGTGSVSVALGDMNNDGNLDIVTANQDATGAKGVSVLLGNGDGTFQTKSDLAAGNSPISASLGDLNTDGKLDIIIANWTGNNISVFLNP